MYVSTGSETAEWPFESDRVFVETANAHVMRITASPANSCGITERDDSRKKYACLIGPSSGQATWSSLRSGVSTVKRIRAAHDQKTGKEGLAVLQRTADRRTGAETVARERTSEMGGAPDLVHRQLRSERDTSTGQPAVIPKE